MKEFNKTIHVIIISLIKGIVAALSISISNLIDKIKNIKSSIEIKF